MFCKVLGISKSTNGVGVLKMAFRGMASAMFLLLEFIITCDEGERFPVRSRKNHRVEEYCSYPSMCRFPQMYLSLTWYVWALKLGETKTNLM